MLPAPDGIAQASAAAGADPVIRRFQMTGSRTWTRKWAGVVHDALDMQRARLQPSDVMLVVVGYDPKRRTPSGVDEIAYEWAMCQKAAADPRLARVEVETHPADWRAHPRTGGHIRNDAMLDRVRRGDVILAFCLDESPGTVSCIEKARRRRLNMIAWFAYSPEGEPADPDHEQLAIGPE